MTDQNVHENDLSSVRGTRDFLPSEKILRDSTIGLIKRIFEKYGFNPLETPALENYSVLASKYAGGAEILKETYKFSDQGGRELGLRYDLTVPLCRVVAANPSLAKPFKRYHIDKVWRDGPVKLGRYREFYQCDCDVIGVKSVIAEAEIIALTEEVFSSLELPAKIKVNNRKVLNALLEHVGVKEAQHVGAILTIDKKQKISREELSKELVKERKIDGKTAEKIAKLFYDEIDELKNNKQTLEWLAKKIPECQGVGELKELIEYSTSFGVSKEFAEIDFTLARGLSYYTGTVFEVALLDSSITSSAAGGGRYDEMIGKFAGKGEEIPAVGIAFGLEVIIEALKQKNTATAKNVTRVFVIPIKETASAIKITQQLRAAGLNAGVDLLERGISKNLDYASKEAIPYVVFVGKKELDEGKIKLRDMQSGKEELITVEKAIEKLNA